MKRYSAQNELIGRIVCEAHDHPTASEVYERARAVNPSVSLGTVYKNLHRMRDEGEIRGFLPADGIERFDGSVDNHSHFVCTKCGRVFDLQVDLPEIATEWGSVSRQELLLYGICNDCKK